MLCLSPNPSSCRFDSNGDSNAAAEEISAADSSVTTTAVPVTATDEEEADDKATDDSIKHEWVITDWDFCCSKWDGDDCYSCQANQTRSITCIESVSQLSASASKCSSGAGAAAGAEPLSERPCNTTAPGACDKTTVWSVGPTTAGATKATSTAPNQTKTDDKAAPSNPLPSGPYQNSCTGCSIKSNFAQIYKSNNSQVFAKILSCTRCPNRAGVALTRSSELIDFEGSWINGRCESVGAKWGDAFVIINNNGQLECERTKNSNWCYAKIGFGFGMWNDGSNPNSPSCSKPKPPSAPSPSAAAKTTNTNKKNILGSGNGGAIAGAIIGAVLLVAIVLFALWWKKLLPCCPRRAGKCDSPRMSSVSPSEQKKQKSVEMASPEPQQAVSTTEVTSPLSKRANSISIDEVADEGKGGGKEVSVVQPEGDEHEMEV